MALAIGFGTPVFPRDSIRVATFHVGMKRKGPGLLLRDILKAGDPTILAARNVIAATEPDVLLLTRFDYDLGLQALTAFADMLAEVGVFYPYRIALAPNSGLASGLDLDRNGYLGDARDAQGYGDFAGHGGMAVLSRLPVDVDGVQDFSKFLWRDLPGARLPKWGDGDLNEAQRLSSVGHWDIPVKLPDGERLHLLAYHATTPVFDGPEDRNGLRNQDETLFWLRYLEGALSAKPSGERFVIVGDANLDPEDGEGLHQAILALLDSGFVQDAEPRSDYAATASAAQGGVNTTHRGDPALDTADWWDQKGPGNLRVDYVLPSVGQVITGAGVVWPTPDDLAAMSGQGGRDISWHGLVWVDIRR